MFEYYLIICYVLSLFQLNYKSYAVFPEVRSSVDLSSFMEAEALALHNTKDIKL